MIDQTVVADGIGPSARRGSTAESWLVGFHGVLQAAHLDADEPLSLRSLALAHRSLGTQRLSVLTELDSPGTRRSVPRGRHGYRPVGLPAGTDLGTDRGTDLLEVAERRDRADRRVAARPPDADADALWDEVEPLADYLDRRLLHARALYLPNRSRAYRMAKRLLDVVGALVLLIVTAPVMLTLAVVIRLDSPGPALFRHERVTLGGRLFTFYKFRTMWVDARERFPDLYDYRRTVGDGDVYYKLEDDPRNTRVGRWLRRTTLDELPNLINVLTGDMSLVGPRPELPQLLSHYRPEDLALFFTKAGLTGLAQVAGRSLLTVRERIRLDLRYVAQQTLILDLRILARTVLVVLVGRGAF